MKLDYSRIDPELLAALEAVPNLDINRDNVVHIRESLAEQPLQPLPQGVCSEVIAVTTPEAVVDVHVLRGSDESGQAAVLWMHGGGYVIGSAGDERAGIIADHCGCRVFSVEYSLAPEHPFPAAINECHAVLQWMIEESSALGIDRERIAIAGASAGAGLAAGLALVNRDRENVPLRMQLLFYPMIDNLHDTASGRYENHPVWNRATSFNAWEMYLDGTPGERASPYAAAARAEDLTGLPPAYICVGSEDLFRDEDIEYARRLSEAGIPCELAVFPGVYHGGNSFAPSALVSKRLKRSALDALADALTQTPGSEGKRERNTSQSGVKKIEEN